MVSLQTRAEIARAQYDEYLARAARDRLVVNVCPARLPFSRRVARPLGHVLLQLSILLLRYARVETPTVLYRSPVQSVELN